MMAKDLLLSKWERLNSISTCVRVCLCALQCVTPAISTALFERDLLTYTYDNALHMCSALGGQKKSLDPLGLEV